MRISFTQSGGFAGLVRGCSIDTATLPPDERRAIESLVAASAIVGDCTALTESARDLRHYEIRIEHDGRITRMCCDERRLPEAARPLVAELASRARPQSMLGGAAGRMEAAPPPGGDGAAAWGRFIGEVVARWNAGGRDMTLVEPFAYVDPRETRWDAPAGAIVNGASIPRPFWSFIGGPFTGAFREASVVHDVACERRDRPWAEAHRMFYEACRCGGVGRAQATGMYYAVYHFGPRWRIETRPTIVAGRPTTQRVVVDETPRQPTEAEARAIMAYVEARDVEAEAVPMLVIPGVALERREDAPDGRHDGT